MPATITLNAFGDLNFEGRAQRVGNETVHALWDVDPQFPNVSYMALMDPSGSTFFPFIEQTGSRFLRDRGTKNAELGRLNRTSDT